MSQTSPVNDDEIDASGAPHSGIRRFSPESELVERVAKAMRNEALDIDQDGYFTLLARVAIEAAGLAQTRRQPAIVTESLDTIDRQLNEMRSLKGWRLNLIRENMAKLRCALSDTSTGRESE